MNERVIFEAAVEIPDSSTRKAFIDKACAANPELKSRVEALLRSHETAGAFLDLPVVEQLPNSTPETHANRFVGPPSRGGGGADGDPDQESDPPNLSFLLQPSDKPGSIGTLGHYEVIEILGHGGFGIVLKAFDQKLQRLVAIKVMNPQLAATSPPRKRFLREARAAAAIRHENVVQVYSVEEQPLPYLVMEYIHGQTLQEKLDAVGPLEIHEVLHIGRQIAAGLAAAHAIGLIHRDIKPSNTLIEQGNEGRVKITDFGLARAADDASLTRTGVISGTPMYMAPEQALGHPLDYRSDLFSLGSVLYVMACGRPPFRAANTIAVLRRVAEDTPRPLREIIPEIPDWLVAIVTRLHAKRPEERFESARVVAELLARHLAELQQHGTGIPLTDSSISSSAVTIVSPVASSSSPTTAKSELTQQARNATAATMQPSEVSSANSRQRRLITTAGLIGALFAGFVLSELAGLTHLTRRVPGTYHISDLAHRDSANPVGAIESKDSAIGSHATPANATPAAVADVDREIARLVLSAGGRCRVEGEILSEEHVGSIEQLPVRPYRLTSIEFERVPVSLALLRRLPELTGLTRLVLWSVPVGDEALPILGRVESLKMLVLVNLPITDAGLTDLRQLPQLKRLTVEDCSGVTSAGLHSLIAVSLEHLNVGGTQIGGDDWKLLSQFSTLKSLAFEHARDFDDEDLRQICRLSQLTSLGLSGTGVSNDGLKYLAGMPELSELTVSHNPQLTDAAVEPLSRLTTLKTLRVDQTGLTFEGVFRLRKALPQSHIISDAVWRGWPADAPSPAMAPFDAEQARKHQDEWAMYLDVPVDYTNSIGMKFRLIPPGEFLFGAGQEETGAALREAPPDSQPGYKVVVDSESPRHHVVLTRPLYVGVLEVRQQDFERVTGRNPSYFSPNGPHPSRITGLNCGLLPVDTVTWNDAVEFCARLSQLEQRKPKYDVTGDTITLRDGDGYELPTEFQWEFACRAGTDTRFSSGDTETDLRKVAWFYQSAGQNMHTVGQLAANPFGLHDMHGNASEWTGSAFEDARRGWPAAAVVDPIGPELPGRSGCVRGGNWDDGPPFCRSASRGPYTRTASNYKVGFRVSLPVNAVNQATKAPIVADPERRAAEWVLGIGGQLTLAAGNTVQELAGKEAIARLPVSTFVVQKIRLESNNAVTDEGLAQLKGLRGVTFLDLSGTGVSDAGLPHLSELITLETLHLSTTMVSDDGLDHLLPLVNLRQLQFYGSRLTDRGMTAIAKMTTLRNLGPGNNLAITDKGVEALGVLVDLEYIDLGGTRVSDTCLPLLAKLPRLKGFALNRTSVTSQGVQSFGSRDDLNFISLTNTQVDDSGLEFLGRQQELKSLYLNNTRVTDQVLEYLAASGAVKSLELFHATNTAISDTGMRHLRDFPRLNDLNVRGTKTTYDSYRDIWQNIPHCQIDADGDSDRHGANWALAVGGKVTIEQEGSAPQEITDFASLPAADFRVLAIHLNGLEQIQFLANIDRLPRIRELTLNETGLGRYGLMRIGGLTSLRRLELIRTNIVDDSLEHLYPLTGLEELDLTGTAITGAAVQRLSEKLPRCRVTFQTLKP